MLNESSLDENLIERIQHNQRYNDDTIFDNFSIFHQLTGDEIKEDGDKKVELPNQDLNVKTATEEPKIEQQALYSNEQHNDSADQIEPFDPGMVIHENVDNRELLDHQDLAELTLENDNDEELISYKVESDNNDQDDKRDLRVEDTSSRNETSTIKQDDQSLFHPSISNISDVSEKNNIVDASNESVLFGSKESNMDDIISSHEQSKKL